MRILQSLLVRYYSNKFQIPGSNSCFQEMLLQMRLSMHDAPSRILTVRCGAIPNEIWVLSSFRRRCRKINSSRSSGCLFAVRCSMLEYVFTLGAAIPAQRYYWRADEIFASSCIKEAVGGIHGEDVSSVSDTKFVGRLGCRCNIGRFCGNLRGSDSETVFLLLRTVAAL